MIHLKQAVIVEGKYDKITLENIVDATIIPLGGFQIFKDKEKRKLLRTLAKRDGIIVMTDSDHAGMMLRSHLKNICADGKIINVYVPQLAGKEPRKRTAGKEGLLGVEGLSKDILLEALARSGVCSGESDENRRRVTKGDLFAAGLSGSENSAQKRKDLAVFLDLPQDFSANAFLDIINTVYTAEEFEERLQVWLQDKDKK